MSKDIIVLTPNARRVTVHCTPDTSILQVLEDVCKKHSYEAREYDLKHHNKILDLTTTIRFSNLPNRACLEMVAAKWERNESNVTVGLQLEDGDRRLGEFVPNTSLLELIMSLAGAEFEKIEHPTILYMRQEIFGVEALKQKTLRHLGLLSGRAILRLLNKSEDEIKMQANVSSVYRSRIQLPENSADNISETKEDKELNATGTSEIKNAKPFEKTKFINTGPIHLIKKCKAEEGTLKTKENSEDVEVKTNEDSKKEESPETSTKMEVDSQSSNTSESNTSLLERRLNIENEVTFIGPQKAIAFAQPDKPDEVLEDLPDDFYDLTVDEVRKLYHSLHSKRHELENAPLLTSSVRIKEIDEDMEEMYKHAVVRVQFPDNVVLQGVFQPTDTIQHVNNFIQQFLNTSDNTFNIFSTAFQGNVDQNTTLLEAHFIPGGHLHFKWEDGESRNPCLKDNVYSNLTNSEAANILASKYRAPNRRKLEKTMNKPSTSTSKVTKLPKWFKK